MYNYCIEQKNFKAESTYTPIKSEKYNISKLKKKKIFLCDPIP